MLLSTNSGVTRTGENRDIRNWNCVWKQAGERSRSEVARLALIEAGSGAPLVYLHGFADVHGVADGLQPFHEGLAQRNRFDCAGPPRMQRVSEFFRRAIGSTTSCFTCARCSTLSISTASRWSDIASAAGSLRSSRCAGRSG